MTRQRLPDRRLCATQPVEITLDSGKKIKILITVGFDPSGKLLEVFCADFRAGTALHAIVMDACILFSRLLQHGDDPRELASSMCQPHSLLGSIAEAVASFPTEDLLRSGDAAGLQT